MLPNIKSYELELLFKRRKSPKILVQSLDQARLHFCYII